MYPDSEKYLLLRHVVTLWIMFLALLFLIDHKIPKAIVHHTVNILIALSAVIEMGTILYISLSMRFY